MSNAITDKDFGAANDLLMSEANSTGPIALMAKAISAERERCAKALEDVSVRVLTPKKAAEIVRNC